MNNFSIVTCTAVVVSALTIGGIGLTAVPASAAPSAAPVSSVMPNIVASTLAAPFVTSIEFDPRQTLTVISGRSEANAAITVEIAGRVYRAKADQYGSWVIRTVEGLTGSAVTGSATQSSLGQVSTATTFTLHAHGDEALASPVVTTTTYTPADRFSTVAGTAFPGAIVGLVINGKRYSTTASTDGTWSIENVTSLVGSSSTVEAIQYLDDRGSSWASFPIHAAEPSAPGAATTPGDGSPAEPIDATVPSAPTDAVEPSRTTPTVTPITFTNPAKPEAGYVADTAFTFRGTAAPGAKITLQNVYGTTIATGIIAAADGTWSWTRANMATSIWKITALADTGTATEQRTTLPDFAPRK